MNAPVHQKGRVALVLVLVLFVRMAGLVGTAILVLSGHHAPMALCLLAMLMWGGGLLDPSNGHRRSASEVLCALPDLRVVHRDERLGDRPA